MTKVQLARYLALHDYLSRWGITHAELDALLRCERTLGRWGEAECNGWIQRDEQTGIPYRWNPESNIRCGRTADREAGALTRASKIAAAHALTVYYQSDPRGCSLYLIRPGDIPVGYTVESCYTNGIALCID